MSTNVLAAIFPDRATAVATRDALGAEHYHFRWLAVTQAAEYTDARPADDVPDVHRLAESSDGPIGAVGRFLSGAGASLRKALEDHGVAEADAEAIDAATPAAGAVLVVHAPEERTAQAVTTLRQGGGTLYPADGTTPARTTGALSEPEAADRGLIPTYDTTGPETTAGAAGTAAGATAAGAAASERHGTRPTDPDDANSLGDYATGDYAGVTTSVGSSPQDRLAAQAPAVPSAPSTAGAVSDASATPGATAASDATASSDAAAAAGAAANAQDDGEYVIRRRVVREMATIEVPIEREEVFIERRRP